MSSVTLLAVNRNLVIVAVIVVLLLIGGGAFLATRKAQAPSKNQAVSPSPVAATSAPTVAQTQGTLKDLLSATTSQTCTFSTTESSVNVSGTVYVEKGKVREDYASSGGNVNMTGHVLVMDGYAYMWNDTTKQGMKIAIPSGAQAEPSGVMQPNSQASALSRKMNFSCKPGNVDSSKFTLPSGVTFSTTAIPSSGGVAPSSGAGSSSNATQCSACNSVPAGDARNACKAQFHCQ